MAAGPFDLSHAPPVGVPEALAPGLRVVTAPNAGPMTFTGTRSYVLGEDGRAHPGGEGAGAGAVVAVGAVSYTHLTLPTN